MDFVDWCDHALSELIKVTNASPDSRLMGVHDTTIGAHLVGEEHFQELGSTRRKAVYDALKELKRSGFIDENSRFYLPTARGREAAKDPKPFWQQVCGISLEEEQEQLLRVWETRRGALRKCDVFISHASDERAAALSLQGLLREAFGEDLKVFVSSDYRSIPGGKIWFTELLEALKSAPVTLVLLSQSSVERRWINFEAGVGSGAGNMVIPLAVTGFSKGDVGHPLSELQARALDDAEDVGGVLRDISTHAGRPFTEIDVKGFAASESAAGGSKLEATVNQVTEKVYEGYEEHKFIVGLVNNSPKTLNDYRAEVEVPNAILNQSTGYNAEVESRRTAESRYFRIHAKDSSTKLLHPGDRIRRFITVQLVIPPGAEASGIFEKMIIVKVFAGDVMTQKIEKTVREVLAMPPSFG